MNVGDGVPSVAVHFDASFNSKKSARSFAVHVGLMLAGRFLTILLRSLLIQFCHTSSHCGAGRRVCASRVVTEARLSMRSQTFSACIPTPVYVLDAWQHGSCHRLVTLRLPFDVLLRVSSTSRHG